VVFRRYIAATIIVSLLGLVTAWAFDTHAAGTAVHEHQLDVSGSTPHSHDEGHGCDHWCHAGAHLIGLNYVPGLISAVTQSMPWPQASASLLISRTTAPPLKPPQS
jgi:hypothetical protein